MKIKYYFLYRNGERDIIEQEITAENMELLQKVNETIYLSMQDGENGIVTFGDSENEGYFIRLSDVTRVRMETLES